MLRFLRTLVAAASLSLPLFGIAPAPANADAGAFHFTPPGGWQPIPSSMIPKPLLTWHDQRSSFSISALTVPVELAQMEASLKAQTATLGTLVSSSTTPVCGKPALKMVVKLKSAEYLLAEQVQTLDGTMFISVYSREATTPADAGIEHVMGTFCGKAGIASLTPPGAWRSVSADMLGIWVGPASPSQMLVAFSRTSGTDAETTVREMVGTTAKSSNVTLVSHSSGTLCGKPAYFFTFKTTPPGMAELEMQAAMTQFAGSSYMVLYSRPAADAADPAAVASLATLCADPNAAAPPTRAAPAAPPAYATAVPVPGSRATPPASSPATP